jgi:hypothetical protein
MRALDPLRAVGLFLAMGLAAGCGGGGRGGFGAAPDPNAPVIANLRVTFGGTCTLSSTGRAGTLEVLTVDYSDADGNMSGGTIESTAGAVAGGPIVFTAPIPSPGVRLTGTTSGTISIAFCLVFGSNASVTEQVRVADASGKISNRLTLEVVRPSGAFLLPKGADPNLGKSL